MHQRAFLGSGWTRGGSSELVRRAHPASGAQWNVQVVRGKVNGKCLWNACKALSLGLLLMVLGAAMATIGYYADHLSIAQEVRGNHTVRIKNESRGFHLNNLSYAGPIVMGVGGFIVVAACVMTFEARDSAAKVVPARLKLNANGPSVYSGHIHSGHSHPLQSGHGSLRTSGSQTGGSIHHQLPHHGRIPTDSRKALTESFMHFSKGLAIKSQNQPLLKVVQGSINKSPSAPNLAMEPFASNQEQACSSNRLGTVNPISKSARTFANCALLNANMLHRHALSVDETGGNYRLSHDSLQGSGSQGSLALDLHLECPITLRIHDRRRNPLMRQKRVEAEEGHQVLEDHSRRSSHSCSPRLPGPLIKELNKMDSGSSAHPLPTHHIQHHSRRRSSNASEYNNRSRSGKREHHHLRGKLERAISSDSRLTGAVPKSHRYFSPTQLSVEQEPGTSSSDTDIRKAHHVVHFDNYSKK